MKMSSRAKWCFIAWAFAGGADHQLGRKVEMPRIDKNLSDILRDLPAYVVRREVFATGTTGAEQTLQTWIS